MMQYTSISREVSQEAVHRDSNEWWFAKLTDPGEGAVWGVERIEGPPQLVYVPSRLRMCWSGRR